MRAFVAGMVCVLVTGVALIATGVLQFSSTDDAPLKATTSDADAVSDAVPASDLQAPPSAMLQGHAPGKASKPPAEPPPTHGARRGVLNSAEAPAKILREALTALARTDLDEATQTWLLEVASSHTGAEVPPALWNRWRNLRFGEPMYEELFAVLMKHDPEGAQDTLHEMLDDRDIAVQRAAVRLLESPAHAAWEDALHKALAMISETPALNERRERGGTTVISRGRFRGKPSTVLHERLASLRDNGWTPRQATGAPDTYTAEDQKTAWAPKKEQEGVVMLTLEYARAVYPDEIRIHETYHPGAITRIEGRGSNGAWFALWEGTDDTAEKMRWFAPRLQVAPEPVRTIRLVLDTDRVKGWNEVDAVELIGDGMRQWARDASATSSYGTPR